MQLSKKVKTICGMFSPLLKSPSNFRYSEKKDDFHGLCISEIIECQRYV